MIKFVNFVRAGWYVTVPAIVRLIHGLGEGDLFSVKLKAKYGVREHRFPAKLQRHGRIYIRRPIRAYLDIKLGTVVTVELSKLPENGSQARH